MSIRAQKHKLHSIQWVALKQTDSGRTKHKLHSTQWGDYFKTQKDSGRTAQEPHLSVKPGVSLHVLLCG